MVCSVVGFSGNMDVVQKFVDGVVVGQIIKLLVGMIGDLMIVDCYFFNLVMIDMVGLNFSKVVIWWSSNICIMNGCVIGVDMCDIFGIFIDDL